MADSNSTGKSAGKSESGGSKLPAKAAKSTGQKSSSERGSATNHKKNPGKRPSQGGSSR